MTTDIDRTRAIFSAEIETLHDWATRRPGLQKLEVERELLLVRATLQQPETGLTFFLEGDFESYRALPPIFTFSSEPWNRSNGLQDYPKQKDIRFVGGSIFINPNPSAPCICVHFNRRAYKEYGGPHGDWGGAARWLEAASGQPYVRATNIPDMFSVIYSRFVDTRGRLSDP